MLLTITTTHKPATDLGYLLHKNPERMHSFELSFGKAHLFYPEATSERCTAAILLDVDPVGLVRGKRGHHEGGTLDQYVNDRPYVLSSFLSVAMGRALGTAMTGRSKGRQELADQKIPLTATLAVVACRGGEQVLKELFEPLGYEVGAEHHSLDDKFPEWGEGPYYTVKLQANVRLQDLLNHLYVLVPVLDAEKHYWIGQDEVEKLLRKGEGWLAAHPHKEAIVNRYLPRQRQLAREALAQLAEEDNPDPDAKEEAHSEEETKMEEPIRLWQQRMGTVVAVLRSSGAKRVLDLGCGEGKALVVYGHTPVAEPEWLNRTINIDTGCVFGGKLTALRYPEKELVSVPAQRTYYKSAKPFLAEEESAPALTAQQQLDDLLDIEDVIGKRIIETRLHRSVTIREENATTALEVMSRWANPRWLIYLPPTMSPCETSKRDGLLEHPEEAFAYFLHEAVHKVVCEQKHMGSRAVVVVCRDADAARIRFGIMEGETGVCYTRTGRRFFNDAPLESQFLDRVRTAVTAAGIWESLKTKWVCLDCELMPWSAKAQELLRLQYAPTGAAARAALPAAIEALSAAEVIRKSQGCLIGIVSGAKRLISMWKPIVGTAGRCILSPT
jgi:hypothetical protein